MGLPGSFVPITRGSAPDAAVKEGKVGKHGGVSGKLERLFLRRVGWRRFVTIGGFLSIADFIANVPKKAKRVVPSFSFLQSQTCQVAAAEN